jgi:LAO/AO transport system kinase
MHQLVQEMLLLRLKQNPAVKKMLPKLEQQVENHEITAYSAARRIMDQF